MEGSYNKIYEARNTVPAEPYVYLTELLMDTIRSEIGASIEKAYPSLRVEDAQKLLRLSSAAETLAFAKQRGWLHSGDQLRFPVVAAPVDESPVGGKRMPAGSVPPLQIIHQSLNYAKELERIV